MKRVFKHVRSLFHGISRLGASSSHRESLDMNYEPTSLVSEPGRSSFRRLRRSFSVGSGSTIVKDEVEKDAEEFMYVVTDSSSVKTRDGEIVSHYLGIVVRDSKDNFVHGFTRFTNETRTDFAELEGIHASINFCYEQGYKKIRIFTDSQHSVGRLMSFKEKWLEDKAMMEIKNLAYTFEDVQIIWVKRNFVNVAHAAAAVKEVNDSIDLDEEKWKVVGAAIQNEKKDFRSAFHKPLAKYDRTSMWVSKNDVNDC